MGPMREVRRGLITLAANLLLLSTLVHAAEEPYPPDEILTQDQLGTWIGGQSTLRLTDRLSGFVQGEVRTWDFFHELNETLFRVAGSYKIAPFAWGAMGYVRADTWPVLSEPRYQEENRFYQEFGLKHAWSRLKFKHRVRLEQRWFERLSGDAYANRVRYKFQIKAPLNRPLIEKGAFVASLTEEVFVHFASGLYPFDQNRLTGAIAYHFSSNSSLTLGLLWQVRKDVDFLRLQFTFVYDADLRHLFAK
jgi:hypothetical protein